MAGAVVCFAHGYDAALDAVVVSFRGTVLGSGLRDETGGAPTPWGFSDVGTIRYSSVRRYDSQKAELHALLTATIAASTHAPPITTVYHGCLRQIARVYRSTRLPPST